MRPLISLFLALGAIALLTSSADAEYVRNQSDGAKASAESLGSVDRSAGWCDDAVSGGATNVWASSNLPAEIDASHTTERSFIRYVNIRVVDGTDTTTPVCVRLGPATNSNGRVALTCTGTSGSEATNGQFLRATGEGRSWHIERIAPADTPQLWIRSSSGTIRYCVEVTWHQRGRGPNGHRRLRRRRKFLR